MFIQDNVKETKSEKEKEQKSKEEADDDENEVEMKSEKKEEELEENYLKNISNPELKELLRECEVFASVDEEVKRVLLGWLGTKTGKKFNGEVLVAKGKNNSVDYILSKLFEKKRKDEMQKQQKTKKVSKKQTPANETTENDSNKNKNTNDNDTEMEDKSKKSKKKLEWWIVALTLDEQQCRIELDKIVESWIMFGKVRPIHINNHVIVSSIICFEKLIKGMKGLFPALYD